MNNQNQAQFNKDLQNKKITVTREFNAAPDMVWRAWTEADILNQWWAPKPWRAETKTMNFSEGGYWLYAMVSPEGEKHWARVDYTTISPKTSFEAQDSFCDEDGNKNSEMPSMHWANSFQAAGQGTKVTCVITFDSEKDFNGILEMGFEEGFASGLNNLDEYLAANAG